jgi:hypothetical protein
MRSRTIRANKREGTVAGQQRLSSERAKGVRFGLETRRVAAPPRTGGLGHNRPPAPLQIAPLFDGGTARPSAFAVLRLMADSNLVDCCIVSMP